MLTSLISPVPENKNSLHILRNLRTKVEHEKTPWGVFKVLDVCVEKRSKYPYVCHGAGIGGGGKNNNRGYKV